MDPEQVAARWFFLRVDDEPRSRVEWVRWRFAWVAAYLGSLGTWNREGRRHLLVEVVRRDDGSIVATFPEVGERRIHQRLVEMRAALLGSDAAGFCAAYDIPRDAVTGPGEDVVEDEVVR